MMSFYFNISIEKQSKNSLFNLNKSVPLFLIIHHLRVIRVAYKKQFEIIEKKVK